MDIDLLGSNIVDATPEFQQSQAYDLGVCVERSPNEWIAFKVASANSSVLSIVGSSLIIFMVFRGRAGLSRLQNRVLVPMSVFDIIGSIGLGFSTTLIPRGSNCTYGAIGNQATCTMQGIMVNLGLTVPFYNAVLCVYYLLVIKHNVRDEIIAKYEPYMHAAAVLPSLIITTVAAAARKFNNYSIVCWLTESDRYDLDRREQNFDPLYTVIVVSVLFLAVVVLSIIIYCMVQLYRFVREREMRMDTYRFPRPDRTNEGRRTSNLSNVVDDTKKQACLYVASFILTNLFATLIFFFDAFFEAPQPYTLLLLHGIFAPLQGFWNFMAYIRPRYILVSREHRDKSFLRRLYITVFQQQSNQLPTRRAMREHQRLRERRKKKAKAKKKSKKKLKKKAEQRAVSLSPRSVKTKRNLLMLPLSRRDDLEPDATSGRLELDLEEGVSEQSSDNFRDNFSNARKARLLCPAEESDSSDSSFCPPASVPIDLRDYREAVSLSLLVAEDILPPSDGQNGQYRRRSMVDYFRGDLDTGVPTNSTAAFSAKEDSCNVQRISEANDEESKHEFDSPDRTRRKHRRHSCPDLLSTKTSLY